MPACAVTTVRCSCRPCLRGLLEDPSRVSPVTNNRGARHKRTGRAHHSGVRFGDALDDSNRFLCTRHEFLHNLKEQVGLNQRPYRQAVWLSGLCPPFPLSLPFQLANAFSD